MNKNFTYLPGLCAALLLLTISASGQENATSVSYDGKVYTFGGTTDILGQPAASNDMNIFDPATGERFFLQSYPPWPDARSGHSASVKGDKMYIFGGKNANGMLLNDMWEFDLKNRRWKKLEPTNPPMPRTETVQCVVGDIAYVCGGTFLEMGSQAYVHALNLTTPTAWIPKAPMQEPLQSSGTYVYNGQVYLFGGFWDDYNPDLPGKQPSYSQNTWQYTPTTNQWQQKTTTGTVPELADFGICQDNSGNVYVSGGLSYYYTTMAVYYENYLRYLNAATGEWQSPLASDDLLKTSGHSLVYVPDGGLKSTGKGKLYHIGGRQANGKITERIVEYDIAGKTFKEVYHPSGVELSENQELAISVYPNPAVASAFLGFALPNSRKVTVLLTDLSGKTVLRCIRDQEYGAGMHTLPLDVTGLSAGQYNITLITRGKTVTKPLIIGQE
jgi:N-acetylneuraminic acid mutarotase